MKLRHPGALRWGRRAWLGGLALSACEAPRDAPPVASAGAGLPTGLVLFSLDFVAGRSTGLPNRSQISLVLAEHAGTGGPIARTLPGPGRLSGQDVAEGSLSLGRVYAISLPARPHSIGRVFVEPTGLITQRNIHILPPLVFTPRPGRALYLGNIAILPHTWQPAREPGMQPPSHRALRDLGFRDIPLLRAREPALAGLEVETLAPQPGWPSRLPPPEAWPDGRAPVQPRAGLTAPPYFGAPNQPLAPPGTPVRQLGQPAPPPGFGPPGVAPGRFGRGGRSEKCFPPVVRRVEVLRRIAQKWNFLSIRR